MANTQSAFYVEGLKNFGKAQFNWLASGGHVFKFRLCDNASYTFNGTAQDTHTTIADVTAVSGTTDQIPASYTDPTPDLTNHYVKYDCADLQWDNVTGEAGGVALYDSSSADKLLCYLGFSSSVTASAGSIVVNINTVGAFTLSWSNIT